MRQHPSTDLVYSEADMAEARIEWEHKERERQWGVQLAQITGQLAGMPDLIRTLARQVVLEVLSEQSQRRTSERRSDLRLTLVAMGGVIPVLIVIANHYWK